MTGQVSTVSACVCARAPPLMIAAGLQRCLARFGAFVLPLNMSNRTSNA